MSAATTRIPPAMKTASRPDPTPALAAAVRRRLSRAADPANAAPMQAYMKSAMPFLGVRGAGVRQAVRNALGEHPQADRLEAALDLWDAAAHREERYAAEILLPPNAPLDVLEKLVEEGAWWDLVDGIAKRIGPHPRMRGWAHDENMWKRRSAIICQLGRKGAMDRTLLRDCIEPNLADHEFFIRKAIGWALRDYARHDPAWVAAYVDELGPRLSPLSRREATRRLPRADS